MLVALTLWTAAAQDADVARRVAEFQRAFRAEDRNASDDSQDAARGDLILGLAGEVHPLIRAELLRILREPVYGPRVIGACVQGLAAYSTDGEVADEILEKARTMIDRRTPARLAVRLDETRILVFENLGLMDRPMLRARVDRIHPYFHATDPLSPRATVQQSAVELVGAVRARESIPPLIDLMAELQREMYRHLRQTQLVAPGCSEDT